MGSLTHDDAVCLVELMARVAADGGDYSAKKRLLLDELCGLIGAQRWSWSLNAISNEGEPRHLGILQGGFSLEQASALSTSSHHPESMRCFAPTYLQVREAGGRTEAGAQPQQVTVLLEEHPGYKSWMKSEPAKALAAVGVGSFVSSVCPLSAAQSSSVTMYRAGYDEPFTARQRDMVHVLMCGVAWLHTIDWPDEAGVQRLGELPSSHAALLTLLVKGYSRHEIAKARCLSVHTVSTYTREVYRHYGVRSQTELMRRFLHGEALT